MKCIDLFIKIATNKYIHNNNKQRSKGPTWYNGNLRHRYFNLTFWALALENRAPYLILWDRINSLYATQGSRRNLRFVHTYLKEVYTVLLFRMAGSDYKPKVWIASNPSGIPKIIPAELRVKILNDRRVFIGCLTLLGVHRVIKWFPNIDLSTILDPFKGTSKVLSDDKIKIALKALRTQVPAYLMKVKKAKFFQILSASPNDSVAIETVIEDALAFLYHRDYALAFIKYLLFNRSYFVLANFLTIIALAWPLVVFGPLKNSLKAIGRIGTVKTVAGKTRVIGITNFWVQTALRPVHDAIFNILRRLPTDGTFDQRAVVDRLLATKEPSFSSFDLSAATDRLPLELQGQVLSTIFGEKFSKLWIDVMKIPMNYEGNTLLYSVGQPMGAYSSWAALAITHHYLVWIAAKGYTDRYAVLGDDVVMHPSYGDEYLGLMKVLGVDVSLPKSIVNSNYIEFAKRLVNTAGDDYSILGPGAITATAKNDMLKPLLLYESFKRGLIEARDVTGKLQSLRRQSDLIDFGINQLFGPKGLITKDPVIAPKGGKVGGLYMSQIPASYWQFITMSAYKQIVIDRHTKMVEECKEKLRTYVQTVWNESGWEGSSIPMKIYHFILQLLSPEFWVPYCAYRKGAQATISHSKMETWEGLFEHFGEMHRIDFANLSRQDIKQSMELLKSLRRYIERDLHDFEITEDPYTGTVHIW